MDRVPFNLFKAIQAAGVLLSRHPNREMSYLRLLKLLYMADRACLAETGKPITGGQQVVMDNGPLHSRIYDMIKGCDQFAHEWSKYIAKENYQVKVVADPGTDRLTKFEVRKLEEVVDEFKDEDDWALVKYTHTLPEVKKNEPTKGSSQSLPFEDVLEAVGLLDKVAQIIQDASDAESVSRTLHGA